MLPSSIFRPLKVLVIGLDILQILNQIMPYRCLTLAKPFNFFVILVGKLNRILKIYPSKHIRPLKILVIGLIIHHFFKKIV